MAVNTLVLLSGGLDSTVLATYLIGTGHSIETVSIHYGQRHAKELDAATRVATRLGVRHSIIDLSALRDHLTGSSLTDNIPVPEGHYAEETMRSTVVPNRNAIMLSVAAGIASARGINQVATAVHTGDHFVYPDCRPAFIEAIGQATQLGTAGFGDVKITAPFIGMTKAGIAFLGDRINAPMRLSWSCYQGGTNHCGRCGTCVERHEAFRLANITDPTTYLDSTFATTVTS